MYKSVEVEILDEHRKVLWKGVVERDGYCYMGELPPFKKFGCAIDSEKGLIIIYSQLVNETLGNRRYIAKLDPEISRKAKFVRLVRGVP